MKAEFTEFASDTNWVSGTIGNFNFNAKLFDNESTFGIQNGRVSKLSIWNQKTRLITGSFFDACIVNYDRGWDIEPSNQTVALTIFDAVMDLLENSPKRFE